MTSIFDNRYEPCPVAKYSSLMLERDGTGFCGDFFGSISRGL